MKRKIISPAEAAQLIGVEEREILSCIKSRTLKSVKSKEERKILLDDFRLWLMSADSFRTACKKNNPTQELPVIKI